MKNQDLVKQLRVALGGFSQEKLARAMCVTLRTIARYEDPAEGPGVEGLVSLYSMAKHHGLTDIAAEFRNAALRTVSDQQEAERNTLALRIDLTDSPETQAFVRKKMIDLYDKCCSLDLDNEPDLDELVSTIEEIKFILESMAERLFVRGSDELIHGINP